MLIMTLHLRADKLRQEKENYQNEKKKKKSHLMLFPLLSVAVMLFISCHPHPTIEKKKIYLHKNLFMTEDGGG